MSANERKRILVEPFKADVLAWLAERAEVVVVDPWREPERWREEASRVDGVISRKGRISAELIRESRGRLKIIARTGVGVDSSRVDIEEATRAGVWVTNIPGVNATSVAELTLGLMIALARKLIGAHGAVKDHRWADYLIFLGGELAGKTLGIVGMGNVGTRVALRARAFEMKLLVFDPYIAESQVKEVGGSAVVLADLIPQADFVTLHCPLTEETRGLIGARELALFKPSAFLINTARGGIVDEAALFTALSRKGIAGAALDVLEQEPPPADHPLFSVDNVIFTPHLGGITEEASRRGEWGAAEEIVRVLEGKRPQNPVNEIR